MSIFYQFSNVLNKKQIKTLNKVILNNVYKKGDAEKAATTVDGRSLKNVDVSVVHWMKVKKYLEEPYQLALYFINHIYGYDTFEMNDFRNINLNVYSADNKSNYGYHMDCSELNENNDLKGTILINVSEDTYKGGEFYYWFNGQEIKIPFLDIPGNMIYLKPHIFHKVTPVTSGTRKTISIFVSGPKWK